MFVHPLFPGAIVLPYYSVPYAVPTTPVDTFADPTATTILALRCIVAPPPPPSPPPSPPPPPLPPSPPLPPPSPPSPVPSPPPAPQPPAPPAPAAPSAAALAGYTLNTLHTGGALNPFSAATVDVADGSAEPAAPYSLQWFFKQPYYELDGCHNASCVAFNADGSVTLTNTAMNGVRIVSGQSAFRCGSRGGREHLLSSFDPRLTRALLVIAGTAFGGGAYFEASVSFNGASARPFVCSFFASDFCATLCLPIPTFFFP